jgi:F0F1-type ATP synthase membrane subunit b/b'
MFRNEEKLHQNFNKEIEQFKHKYEQIIEQLKHKHEQSIEQMKNDLQKINKLSIQTKFTHDNDKQQVCL